MKVLKIFKTLAVIIPLLSSPAFAQYGSDYSESGYDQYESFQNIPKDLDQEFSEYFGRFFQINLDIGTAAFTGGMSETLSSGLYGGVKFIFFFDRVWAAELGGGYSSHQGILDLSNTGSSNIDVKYQTTLIPINLGLRYAFDPELLPRSISMMNPYLSGNFLTIFRKETVTDSTAADFTGPDEASLEKRFGVDASTADTAFGLNFGGGIQFDVYQNKIYLGVDVRYHLTFWSDSAEIIQNNAGESGLTRDGDMFSIALSITQNY